MNHRDLDRWITGNGGEDQYPDADNYWECPTCGLVYWPPTQSCSKCSMIINVTKDVPDKWSETDDDGC